LPCFMGSPLSPMTAKDSRRVRIPSRLAVTSPLRPSRVGFGTGYACATALAAGATRQWLAATTLAAVRDRYFADGGHVLDFLEKSVRSD
jgi:hypothetical protein